MVLSTYLAVAVIVGINSPNIRFWHKSIIGTGRFEMTENGSRKRKLSEETASDPPGILPYLTSKQIFQGLVSYRMLFILLQSALLNL